MIPLIRSVCFWSERSFFPFALLIDVCTIMISFSTLTPCVYESEYMPAREHNPSTNIRIPFMVVNTRKKGCIEKSETKINESQDTCQDDGYFS